jgi:hypothetical protein
MVVAGILVAIILGFLVVYYLFWRVGPDGSIRPLGQFLPFGRAPEDIIVPERGAATDTPPVIDGSSEIIPQIGPVLEKVTDKPVAGSIILPQKSGQTDGEQPKLRYMDRATGHTYEYQVAGVAQNILGQNSPKRLTNTTIPRVYEAEWVETGKGVIARYLAPDERTIRSFYGRLVFEEDQATTSVGALEGVFLPENITAIDASPDGMSIFYIIDNGNFTSMIRSAPNGSSKRTMQTTGLKYWQAHWPAKNEIIIASKPSYSISGFAQSMNLDGASKSLAYRVNGLTVLGDQISRFFLFGGQYNSGYVLSVFDNKSHKGASLPLITIPEKCVWSELEDAVFCAVPKERVGADEPDKWYMGITRFNDEIWKINVETGKSEKIMDLELESGEFIDAVDLRISKDDSLIIFRNKRDGSLWALTILSDDE